MAAFKKIQWIQEGFLPRKVTMGQAAAPRQTVTTKANRFLIYVKHLAVATLFFPFNPNHPNKHIKALNSFQRCKNIQYLKAVRAYTRQVLLV